MDYKHIIYFDEPTHGYTDEVGNIYTSVTTLINKYVHPFPFDKMAHVCTGKGRHRGMNTYQVKELWKKENEDACEKGSKKHHYLDSVIKNASGFTSDIDINTHRITTISDIIDRNIAPTICANKLKELGLQERYPDIYHGIAYLAQQGYKGYSELGLYWSDWLISGCLDNVHIHFTNNNEFIIFDWKTNKHPLEYKAGYYKKDNYGNITNMFIEQNTVFKEPLNYLPQCNGYIYSLQISLYTYILEQWGFKCDKLILTHIRDINNKEEIQIHKVNYMKKDVELMVNHHLDFNKASKKQYKLF